MKKLESPNQSLRSRSKIDMIVVHATAGASMESAVDWMMNPKAQVSAHYCIGKDGAVVQLVQESKKAWHAGKSLWKGLDNLNENSIGIELVNLNDGKDDYPEAQIDALAAVIADIQHFYTDITDDRIVGHDQICPGRKSDPGILFPWVSLGVKLERLRRGGEYGGK